MNDRELDRIAGEAKEWILFADGLSDAGFEGTARRGRNAARDLLALVQAVRDERAVRERAQELHRDALALLGQRAAAAARERAA